MNDDFNISIDPDARNDITRRILHASGGDISVQSAPGKGAEFTISLPRVSVRTREAASS